MADEVFRYRDGDRDELVVLFYPGDETIVVNSSSYGESSRVPLSREEGIKLAHAILAALDADPELGLTPPELDGMPEGMEVYDNELERWTKYGYEWEFYAGNLLRSSADLVELYGPITAKDGVGSSRHADKTETGDTP